jgi:HD-like signal output (HDOD) protein
MAQDVNEKKAEELLKGIQIPPKPQLLIDIREAYPEINKIAALISQDASLSAAVLKTVNSPFFGLPRKITSIQQAAILLGLNSVQNIVTSLTLRAAMSREVSIDIENFWQVSMDVALIASAIAKRLRIITPDEAYTLGLFHNSGVPLLAHKFSNYDKVQKNAYSQPDGNLPAYERQVLGMDHAVVGFHVCKTWNLPEDIGIAIANHHNILSVSESDMDPEIVNRIMLLKLAEHMTELPKVLAGVEDNHEWTQIGDLVLDHLGLTEDDYHDLREDILDNVTYNSN